MKNILQVYENASGQIINLDKSAVCFSEGSSDHRKGALSAVLGISLSEDLELLVVALWRIWFCRNRFVHEIVLLPTIDVLNWSLSFVSEFLTANLFSPVKCVNAGPILSSWKSPEQGWYKLNVNAFLRSSLFLVGLRAVMRDSYGQFMADLSRKLVGSVSIEVAEVAAILNVLHLAIQLGFFRLIISDILSLCSTTDVAFSFIPRSANVVVHSLVRNSFSIDVISVWLEDALSWLDQFLSTDLHG
ncbi:hypothetical protein ACOSP7_024834 [Xanthoceras sorbifolium]